MPPRASMPIYRGKCKNCRGRGIVIKKIIGFLPFMGRCPECRGRGGIEEIFNNRERVRLPYPKNKLVETLSEHRYL